MTVLAESSNEEKAACAKSDQMSIEDAIDLLSVLKTVHNLPAQLERLTGHLGRLRDDLDGLIHATSQAEIEKSLLIPYQKSQQALREHAKRQQEERRRQIIENTLRLLQGPSLNLPMCVRLVGYLRQQQAELVDARKHRPIRHTLSRSLFDLKDLQKEDYEVLISPEHLPWTFMASRNANFKRQMAMGESGDVADRLESYLHLLRDVIYPVILQFRTVFGDDKHPALSTFLLKWIHLVIDGMTDGLLKAPSTLVLAQTWNHFILVNRPFLMASANLAPFLQPHFYKRAMEISLQGFLLASTQVTNRLTDEKYLVKAISGSLKTIRTSENDCQKDFEPIRAYPMMMLLLNAAIEGLNHLRYFAHPSLKSRIAEQISAELSKIEALCFDQSHQHQTELSQSLSQFRTFYESGFKRILWSLIDQVFEVEIDEMDSERANDHELIRSRSKTNDLAFEATKDHIVREFQATTDNEADIVQAELAEHNDHLIIEPTIEAAELRVEETGEIEMKLKTESEEVIHHKDLIVNREPLNFQLDFLQY